MSEVQESYRVSGSAVRWRRLLGLAVGPLIVTTMLLRLYWADAFAKVGLPFWLASIAVVLYTTWFGVSASRRWLKWAGSHRLDITDGGLVLVDGEESERRAFTDIASLEVTRIAGRVVRARITYAGGLKQDLSVYERLSDLVVSIRSHLPLKGVRE